MTDATDTTTDATTGYAAVAIAVLFFGSNFVPVKKYDTGDGMFYQWLMASAIFLWGLGLQLYLCFNPPPGDTVADLFASQGLFGSRISRADAYAARFEPLAVLGGAFWALGNTMSVPAINAIGLSMGLLIWGSTNMLMGWATGRFGLFGTHADALASPDLNSMGIGLAVAALCLYTLVKAEAGDPQRYAELDERDLFPTGTAPKVQTAAQAAASAARRVAGVAMAMTAGLLFGNTFTPPTYLMHNELGSPHPLDYVFAHFCGIYALSTAAFVAYCGYKGARGAAPFVDGRLVLPGLLSGLMWAAAQTCWFVANDALSMSVAFPLITSGPGVVSAAWGVLVFKEIRGTRNYCVLALAVSLTIAGCVMIGMSRGD